VELALNGFAVVAPNYRLTSQVPPAYLPEQIYDAKAVVRWVRGNAVEYNLDSSHIGSIGGSAGAFLSTSLGTSAGVVELEGNIGDFVGYDSSVQASVGLAGVYNWLAYYRQQISACALVPVGTVGCTERLMFSCAFNDGDCLERMWLSSSFHQISADDPSSLIAIGDSDGTPNGLADHTAFHEALSALNVDSTLIIVPGAEHGDLLPDIMPVLLQFFNAHLKGD